MSLYNLYRPKDWDSVIGQEYITTILRNSIETGRVHHAYLFHGSRGTGKTTSARILAKAVNCLDPKNGNPCHKCVHCQAFDNDAMLDVIEIDGASNNGVENVRELIEKARFEPNQGAYKIYIIDEVHMLSTGAFNALLKTLEQPPSHVKFILATTEIDKVPETIRSRALRFDFRKITQEDIEKRLTFVCESEGVTYDTGAIKIIAKAARGGLRDALTLLEQNILDGHVSLSHVQYSLSLIDEEMIESCIDALIEKDIPRIQSLIAQIKEKHLDARGFFEQMMYGLRDRMVLHIEDAGFEVSSRILSYFEDAYTKLRLLPDGLMLIEITLLRAAQYETSNGGIPIPKKEIPKKEPRPITPTPPKPVIPPEADTHLIEEKSPLPLPPEPKNETTKEEDFSFPRLINELKKTNPALTTDLKSCRFRLDPSALVLIFSKKWNYDRVNTPKIKNLISESYGALYGNTKEIVCELQEGTHIDHSLHEVF